jgi:hypothetical protein
VGKTITNLDAAISSTGNSIIAGQNSVRIVRSVADGLLLDVTGGNVITLVDGLLVTGPGTFVVSEGWERAFSSSIGVAGQTNKTQIIFEVNGLPDNVQLTFPSPLINGNFGTLVSTTGFPVTLDNQSPTNRVTYEFTEGATSPVLIDGFSITPALTYTGVPGTGSATIQVALGPFGAAVPNATFPSTGIPRFDPVFLPAGSGPTQATVTKVIPILGGLDDQSISISNTSSGGAALSIRARATDGSLVSATGVTNATTLSVPARQTALVSLKDLFGTAASVTNVSAIEVESQNPSTILSGIGTSAGRRFSAGRPPQGLLTYLPFDRLGISDIPALTVFNSSGASQDVTVTLRSSTGSNLATAVRSLNSLGSFRETFSTLFPAATSLPQSGYITVRSPNFFQAALLNNPKTAAEETPTLSQVINSPIVGPFFAFGGPYNTVLSLINSSDTNSARVSLQVNDTTGNALGSPFITTLAANERQNFDFKTLFGAASPNQIVTGSFSVTLAPTSFVSPFQSPPAVFGAVRLIAGAGSAVLPLSEDSGKQYFLTPGTETSAGYTGVVISNSSANAITVTADVFSVSGATIGTTTFTVNANTTKIQLVRELVPASLNTDNFLVRITSNANVKVVGIRGTLNLSELIYLKSETP